MSQGFSCFAISLDQISVTADTSAAAVGCHLHFATLAKASLIGLYERRRVAGAESTAV